MLKKILIIFAVFVLVIVSFFCIFIFASEKSITINPKNITKENYNNYVTGNSIDYYGGRFIYSYKYFAGTRLIMVNSEGESEKYYYNMGDYFQLIKSGFVYLKGTDLVLKTMKESKISSKAISFVALEDGVLYSELSEPDEENLYWYNMFTKQIVQVDQNILAYCVNSDRCIVLGSDGWITIHSVKGSEKIVQVDICSIPFYFMVQKDCIVFENKNRLQLLDMHTGKKSEVVFTERTNANDRFVFICDADQIFLSFQARQTDGSLVSDIENSANGLWCVDVKTLKAEKVSEETYDELYLFDNILFGISNETLYKISTSTYETKNVTN